jgi:HSP20 family protein
MRYQIANRNTWSPFAQLMKQFEDDFFTPMTPLTTASSVASPRMEWQENEKAYFLSFDIPGMKQEDIKIDLKDNVLMVEAERKQASETKEGESFRSERFYGLYQRSISLPHDVKAEDVQADYHDGVLEIYIPKSEKTQSKSIQIGREGKLSERFLSSKEKAVGAKKTH